jgi:hypothetical protein
MRLSLSLPRLYSDNSPTQPASQVFTSSQFQITVLQILHPHIWYPNCIPTPGLYLLLFIPQSISFLSFFGGGQGAVLGFELRAYISMGFFEIGSLQLIALAGFKQ